MKAGWIWIAIAVAACGGSESPTFAGNDPALTGAPPASTTLEVGQSCPFVPPQASGCPFTNFKNGGCWTNGSVNYCSVECEMSVPSDQRTLACPAGLGCRRFAGAFGLCFKTGSGQSDCASGTTFNPQSGLCEPPQLWPFTP